MSPAEIKKLLHALSLATKVASFVLIGRIIAHWSAIGEQIFWACILLLWSISFHNTAKESEKPPKS